MLRYRLLDQRVPAMCLNLAAARLRAELPSGKAPTTRVRLLDAVPFTRSWDLDLEVWHKSETTLELSTLGRYYLRPVTPPGP